MMATTIPPEAIQIGAKAAYEAMHDPSGMTYVDTDTDDYSSVVIDGCVDLAHVTEAALAAALPHLVEKQIALIQAVEDWAGSIEGNPTHPSDARLLKAFWIYQGDQTEPCPECDGQCGEPCAPCTVAQAHASLDRFVEDWMRRHGARLPPPPAGSAT
jgi:hypothetical protein